MSIPVGWCEGDRFPSLLAAPIGGVSTGEITMAAVTLLEWDSEFFGFPIAKTSLQNEISDVSLLRDAIVATGCRLCYIYAEDVAGNATAIAMGAKLVDRRTLLRRALSPKDGRKTGVCDGDIAIPSDLPRLRELALQSAQFSRFRTDPAMPTDAWVRLYERWADNSLAGTMADAVLVVRVAGEVVGMLTVGCRDGAGTIGLFAVDQTARGRGFGTALLDRGSAWFSEQGCTTASVVTQGDNLAAQRLYERAGYAIAEVTDVYHLWLASKGDLE